MRIFTQTNNTMNDIINQSKKVYETALEIESCLEDIYELEYDLCFCDTHMEAQIEQYIYRATKRLNNLRNKLERQTTKLYEQTKIIAI